MRTDITDYRRKHRKETHELYIQQIIKNQECNLYGSLKVKVDKRKKWKMPAN